MYRIGLFLGAGLFLAGVVEEVLRVTHYIELIDKAMPWLSDVTTPKGIWVTIVVGLLIFLAAWSERRKEREKVESQPPAPAPSVSAVASPHIEVKPEFKGIENRIEHHEHYHLPEDKMKEFGRQIAKSLKQLETTEEQPPADFPPYGGGFVQCEERSICITSSDEVPRVSSGDLRVGEVIRIQFHYANRGGTPVRDCQSWGVVVVVDPEKNPGPRLREVMLNGIKEGYEKFKGSGSDLGVGIKMHNFGVGTPLTEAEIAGMKDGSLRAHAMFGGAWRDMKGNPYYWVKAEWTNWPQVPIEQSFWKSI
jgi:hypothetical protein